MDALVVVGWIAAAFYVLSALQTWLLEGVAPSPVRWLTRQMERRRQPMSTPEPAQALLLELELRRIAERLQLEYASAQPAKAERIRGWFIAYDGVLIELCESSSLTPPDRRLPLSAEERFALEHALVGSGRSW